MANIHNHNFHNLRLEINLEDYWDFFISRDDNISDADMSNVGKYLYDTCLSAFIDASDEECIQENELVSKSSYLWEEAISTPHVLHNVGYTGVDNGLIHLERDRIDNRKFVDIYQNSTYVIDGEKSLKLHKITSPTKLYEYPVSIEDGKIRLNGGFYQGFFKTKDCEYQVLPSELRYGDTWHWEFTLNKTEFPKESTKTLNDLYPNNKGIFFYIGTRAENKWDYYYTKDSDKEGLYVDEYVDDNGDIGTNCKTNAFVDMTIDMPIEWESEAIDDYLNFKYYDDTLYSIEEDGLEDYFYETHKAEIIDEDVRHSIITCWCKNTDCNTTSPKKRYRKSCCCPSKCRRIETEIADLGNNACEGYLSKCAYFDLISDFDEIEDGVDYLEDDLDLSYFEFETYEGLKLTDGWQTFLDTDNKFLLFDRTCNGYTVNDYREGDIVRYVKKRTDFKENLFLLMNRTCTGYTTNDIDEIRDSVNTEYNTKRDITSNAFALRITDDGKIGYRYIVQDCNAEDFDIKILEGYTMPNIIKENEWTVVNVRVSGFATTMRLEFYVNGKLVYITKELPKFNFRKLDDIDEKQETVAYNISLGGGTQGLCETILPNYMENPYRIYALERNFAGTFIGYISKLRFYTCKMDFFDIENNFKHELHFHQIFI